MGAWWGGWGTGSGALGCGSGFCFLKGLLGLLLPLFEGLLLASHIQRKKYKVFLFLQAASVLSRATLAPSFKNLMLGSAPYYLVVIILPTGQRDSCVPASEFRLPSLLLPWEIPVLDSVKGKANKVLFPPFPMGQYGCWKGGKRYRCIPLAERPHIYFG